MEPRCIYFRVFLKTCHSREAWDIQPDPKSQLGEPAASPVLWKSCKGARQAEGLTVRNGARLPLTRMKADPCDPPSRKRRRASLAFQRVSVEVWEQLYANACVWFELEIWAGPSALAPSHSRLHSHIILSSLMSVHSQRPVQLLLLLLLLQI